MSLSTQYLYVDKLNNILMTEPTAKCYRCKQEKPLSMFYLSLERKNKRQTMCKTCRAEYMMGYSNRTEVHPKRLQQVHNCFIKHKSKYLETDRKRRAKFRLTVLQKISGKIKPVCNRCGCDDFRCLEINHINGGGCKEFREREILGGSKFYRLILTGQRKIEDLNILCRPCNNLEHLERRFGQLPFKIIWEGKKTE